MAEWMLGLGTVGVAAVVVLGGSLALLAPRGAARGDDDDAPPSWEPAALTRLAAWQPGPPKTARERLRAYLWASPMTLLGLALLVTSRGTFNLSRDGVLLTDARGPFAAQMRRRGFSASALGHVVIARGQPSAALLTHERLHTRQAERLGPLFGPVYLVLLAVYGYRRHPMERAARAAARGLASGDST